MGVCLAVIKCQTAGTNLVLAPLVNHLYFLNYSGGRLDKSLSFSNIVEALKINISLLFVFSKIVEPYGVF